MQNKAAKVIAHDGYRFIIESGDKVGDTQTFFVMANKIEPRGVHHGASSVAKLYVKDRRRPFPYDQELDD